MQNKNGTINHCIPKQFPSSLTFSPPDVSRPSNHLSDQITNKKFNIFYKYQNESIYPHVCKASVVQAIYIAARTMRDKRIVGQCLSILCLWRDWYGKRLVPVAFARNVKKQHGCIQDAHGSLVMWPD